MSDYIKREDAIQTNVSQVEFCKSEGLDFSGKLHIDSIINNLKHIPAADVVERKTGKWVFGFDEETGEQDLYAWTCSLCGKKYPWQPNFCPNCGADMREETEDIPMEYFESGGK